MSILRSMDGQYNYDEFSAQVAGLPVFFEAQQDVIRARLAPLDICTQAGNSTNRVSSHFKPGQLTIIQYVATLDHVIS